MKLLYTKRSVSQSTAISRSFLTCSWTEPLSTCQWPNTNLRYDWYQLQSQFEEHTCFSAESCLLLWVAFTIPWLLPWARGWRPSIHLSDARATTSHSSEVVRDIELRPMVANLKCIFLNGNRYIFIQIILKFVHDTVPIDHKSKLKSLFSGGEKRGYSNVIRTLLVTKPRLHVYFLMYASLFY